MSEAPPLVRRAEAGEEGAVAKVLTDAFVDEAGLNYWLRQGRAKTAARRRFFEAGVRKLISPQRELWVAQADSGARLLGAAIWLPPGVHAFQSSGLQEVLQLPLFISMAGFGGMKRGQIIGAELAKRHPAVPHAHLSFLGVAPSAQGFGIGSAILKHTLAHVDALKATAFLEATTERNAALYRRHGFEVTAEFDVPDGGPHFWCMTRPAAS